MTHKKFRLIVIGDEILSGKRQDKHMSKMIELLNERGLSLHQVEYVGDDREAITSVLKKSFATNDVVFSTGGIGSTPDDHTRQCAAAALNVPLALHPDAKELIAQRIKTTAEGDAEKVKLSNPDNVLRMKMGEFPAGSEIIPNSYNLIPGFRIKEHHFFPGFPVMATPMMAWVLDELYADLFHLTDFVEKSFIIPLGMEASLTTLMEQIEATHSGVKVFSLPSVGDPRKGGVFAKRHIELGLKGSLSEVDEAFPFLMQGVLKLGFEVHDLPQAGD
uniref:competence/damage-inducible protein A n=1 Tax=Polynucleobacter sp. TaxID=2029855 RepID=UPI004048894E